MYLLLVDIQVRIMEEVSTGLAQGFNPLGQTGINSNSQKDLQLHQYYQVPRQEPQHHPPQRNSDTRI